MIQCPHLKTHNTEKEFNFTWGTADCTGSNYLYLSIDILTPRSYKALESI